LIVDVELEEVTKIEVYPTSMTLKVGEVNTFNVEAYNDVLEVFDVTQQSKATAENSNVKVYDLVIRGEKVGSSNVTVSYGGKTATIRVTVVSGDSEKVAVDGVTVKPEKVALTVGETTTLIASVSPLNATNKEITWTSSNTAIATVGTDGKVTAIKAGEVTIKATTKDGSKEATCTVIVTNKDSGSSDTGDKDVAVKEVILNKDHLGIIVGQKEKLNATVLPTNAENKKVTWDSSNPAVATVSSSGEVVGVSAGTATITVRTSDGGKKATCLVMVSSSTTGFEYLIRDINISGYNFDFNNQITEYNLAIKDEKSLDLEVILSNDEYTYTIVGNQNLSNGKVITVLAQGDNRVEEYRFVISNSIIAGDVNVPSTGLNSPIITIISSIIFITIGGLMINYYVSKKKKENQI